MDNLKEELAKLEVPKMVVLTDKELLDDYDTEPDPSYTDVFDEYDTKPNNAVKPPIKDEE